MQILRPLTAVSQHELERPGIPGTFVADLQRFPAI
jgi:hypothetical protein